MTEKDAFQWCQVSPERYERDADTPEQFYNTIVRIFKTTGHIFFAIVAVLEFSLEDNSIDDVVITNAFRYAWRRLRYQFPTIASQVVYDTATKTCRKVYQVIKKDDELNDWLDSTITVELGTRTAQEYANDDTPLGDYASLHLFKAESVHDMNGAKWSLLFRSHHDVVDGLGTFKILNHLFTFAAEYLSNPSTIQSVRFGDEISQLSPPLQVQAKITKPTEKQLAKLNAQKELNDQNRAELPILCYPGEVTAPKSGRSQQITTKLSMESSDRIIKACKVYGITPTHLFHAAIGLALRDLQPRSDKDELKRYMTYALVDLRKACPDSDNHPASVLHTVSTNHLVLDLIVPAASETPVTTSQEELLSTVNTVRDYYKSIIIDQDFLAVVPTVMAPPQFSEDHPPIPIPAGNRTVSLSSLGLIDAVFKPNHGLLHIHSPSVIGAEYGTGLGVFLGTFVGEIHVWAGYNEAFHEETDVKEYLDLVCKNALLIVDAMK